MRDSIKLLEDLLKKKGSTTLSISLQGGYYTVSCESSEVVANDLVLALNRVLDHALHH